MKFLYRIAFQILKLLPSYWNSDLNNLSGFAKGITAARYWLTVRIRD